jgi:predicted nucleotidyltransferase
LGVKDIYIAWSYSKWVESQDSDIDLILKVNNEDLDWSIFGIFFDIENQLKVKIDIGFLDSLNKDIEGNVKNSLIKIF